MRSSIGAIWNFAFVVMDAFIVDDQQLENEANTVKSIKEEGVFAQEINWVHYMENKVSL